MIDGSGITKYVVSGAMKGMGSTQVTARHLSVALVDSRSIMFSSSSLESG